MRSIQLLSFMGLCLFMLPAASEIYKWVDETGKVHYGDKPVENASEVIVDTSKKGHVNTGSSREEKRRKLIDAFNEDRERENEEKAKIKKKKQKTKAWCNRSRDLLRNAERASSLYNLDKEGNRVTLSNDQRQQSTENLRKKIKKYCN